MLMLQMCLVGCSVYLMLMTISVHRYMYIDVYLLEDAVLPVVAIH